jgi:tripartite-type tricarboxylate transporter receptor subunit TctC
MLLRLLSAILVVFGILSSASAENYPVRPVTVVIPFPPGGLDFLLRTIQSRLEETLGQPIVIENKPGATGNIGNAYVAKAVPDGYTLLFTATNIGVFPHMFENMAYDPLKDFAVIGEVGETPGVFIVNNDSKFQSLADLVKEAKANPGTLTYGTPGNGSPSHLNVELLAKANDLKLIHAPYRGAVPAVTDVMGNFISFASVSLTSSFTLIRDGKVRALAVSTDKRSNVLPNVSTINETGMANMNESSRYILLAPAATPAPVMEVLQKALAKALADPEVGKTYVNGGFDLGHSSPAEVAAMIQQQYDFWGPFIRDLKLKR